MKAAHGRELRARAELKQGHAATVREGFFTAAVLYGGAQWPIAANTPLNLDLAGPSLKGEEPQADV